MSATTQENKRGLTREQIYNWVKDAVAEINQAEADKLEERFSKIGDLVSKSQERDEKYTRILDRLAGRDSDESADSDYPRDLIAPAMFRMVAAAKKRGGSPVDIAAKQYGADHVVTKALEASSASGGGFLIEGRLSADFIENLRARAVVEAAGPMRLPLDRGSVSVPKMTTGGTATWYGEGENITHTTPAFGQVTLTARNLGATTAISNDLLQYATPDVDRIVRDDLVRAFAAAEDLAFLTGDGTASQPKGLEQLEGINNFSANTTVTLAGVTGELTRALQELMDDNVMIDRGHWFWSNRTWKYLFSVLDSNGNPAFRDEMSRGSLYGYPFSNTSQITNTQGGGSDSDIYFVNMNDVIVGRASSIEIDASDTAAYHNGSAVVAAFSLNQTVVRAISKVDINSRYSESICLIDTVRWGS